MTNNLLLVFLSLVCAYFSWKYIETPFRDVKRISPKIFAFSIIISVFVISSFGFYLHKSNGAPLRVFESQEEFKMNSHEFKIRDSNHFIKNEFDPYSQLKVLVAGDSFASDVIYLLTDYYKKYDLDIIRSEFTACYLMQNKNNPIIKDADVLIFAWDEGHDSICLEKSIIFFQELEKEVYFFGTKNFGDNLNWVSRLDKYQRRSLCQAPSTEYLEIEDRDKKNIQSENYISIFDALNRDGCYLITTPEGDLISSDRKHLTIAGIEFLSERIFSATKFDALVKTKVRK